MLHHVIRALAAIALVATTVAVTAIPAYGHERRSVGPYQLVVGWLNEPAFAGQPNAASVRVSDTRETPAKAVEGLEKSLKIEVAAGGLAPYTGTVRAVFGQPGLYALDLYPTIAGQYRYRVTGTIGSTAVNETFESGPATFNDVQATSPLQYPAKVPTGDDLTSRLDAIQAGVDQTRLIAIAALALAAIAVGAGIVAGQRRA